MNGLLFVYKLYCGKHFLEAKKIMRSGRATLKYLISQDVFVGLKINV